MNTLDIAVDKRVHRFEVPQNWKECNRRQLIRGLAALRSGGSVHDSAVLMLVALLDVRPWQLRKQWDIIWLTDEDITQCIDVTMPFLSPENEDGLMITEQLVPSFRHKLRRYYGPKNVLEQCTAAEFAHCEYHYRCFQEDPTNVEPLAKLLAVLYRPGKADHSKGDWREPFNEYACAHRAKQLKQLHVGYLYYGLELYRGAQFALKEHFPQLFNESGASVTDFRNAWAELIIEVAGEKFGTIDKVQQTPVGDIFLFLRQTKEANDKMKNKYGQ